MNLGLHGNPLATRQIGSYALTLTRYDRAASIPLHAHDEPYVTVVVSGAYREITSAATRECAAHSIVIHAAGERHSDVFADRTTTCLNVHGGTFERSAVLATDEASSISAKLRQEFRSPDSFSPIVLEALMLELVAAIGRQPEDDRAPSWLREVRSMIERRFRETLTLAALAETVSIHPTHLARAFRRHYHTTVGEMLRDLRLACAKRQLESGAPLHQVALDCGFADQSHFTRTFRRATGVTPANFRRSLR